MLGLFGQQNEAPTINVLRDRIAFYGCTVAYKPVLDIHGWGDIQDELIALNRQHDKPGMASMITDEMVETIGIVGSPEFVVAEMQRRFAGVISRTGFGGLQLEADEQTELLNALKRG